MLQDCWKINKIKFEKRSAEHLINIHPSTYSYGYPLSSCHLQGSRLPLSHWAYHSHASRGNLIGWCCCDLVQSIPIGQTLTDPYHGWSVIFMSSLSIATLCLDSIPRPNHWHWKNSPVIWHERKQEYPPNNHFPRRRTLGVLSTQNYLTRWYCWLGKEKNPGRAWKKMREKRYKTLLLLV